MASYYGIADTEGLIEALLLIKNHVPPDQRPDDEPTDNDD